MLTKGVYMDETLILEKFNEWTTGLDPVQARIAIFNNIRDIPYMIVPELRDPIKGPSGLLAQGKGSCQPKHWLLAILFGKLNIPVKYATYVFSWDDARIRYPAELKKIVKSLPLSYHLACKANIDGDWILVDATYDTPLKKAGLPITEKWDGVSNTRCAVNALEEVLHDTVEERVAYEVTQKSSYTEADKALYAEFVDKLNEWLDKVRNF